MIHPSSIYFHKATTMNAKAILLASLIGTLGLAAAGSASAQIDTLSPSNTTQRGLHDVQADYATTHRATHVAAAPAVVRQASATPAAAAFDTAAPGTTSEAQLHNVAADVRSTHQAQQRAAMVASAD